MRHRVAVGSCLLVTVLVYVRVEACAQDPVEVEKALGLPSDWDKLAMPRAAAPLQQVAVCPRASRDEKGEEQRHIPDAGSTAFAPRRDCVWRAQGPGRKKRVVHAGVGLAVAEAAEVEAEDNAKVKEAEILPKERPATGPKKTTSSSTSGKL